MMNIWNIKLWVALYLPSFLGKVKQVSWLAALLKPVKTIHGMFTTFRAEFNDGIRYNSQSAVLEAYLNNLFDPEDRRLRVINQEFVFVPRFHYFLTEGLVPNYYFLSTEPHAPYFFYGITERDSALYNFLVSYPVGLVIDLNKLRAAINFRRLAGTRYKLVKVESDLVTPIEFLTQEYE